MYYIVKDHFEPKYNYIIHSIFILQYIEKRTRSGDAVVTSVEESGQGLGFCPDFTPDKTVGVATERLLVGSQDVAHNCTRLKELGVTHILNVAARGAQCIHRCKLDNS